MVTLRNRAKEKLEKGELCIGLGIRTLRTMDAGRILNTCGYDYAFIDMEHNAMHIDTAVQMAVACQDADVTPLIRVPGYEHHHASRVLDAGAMGIVFPHVDTAEQAAKLVGYCKYPPMGHRSAAGPMAQLNYTAVPQAEACDIVNKNTLIVIMLESPKGIENADAIAAIPGVDVILIGTNDLCMEMGTPGQFASPKVEDAYKKVIAACRKHGKHAGMGGIYDETVAQKYIGMGVRFILSGGDLGMFMSAATARAKFLHSVPLK